MKKINRVKFLMLAGALALMITGGAGLVERFNNIKEYRKFEKRACIGVAKVLKIGSRRLSNNVRQEYITYQFKDDSFRYHEKYEGINFKNSGAFKEGESIIVLYDPANTDDVRYAFLENFAFKQRLNVRLVVAGIIIIALVVCAKSSHSRHEFG